MTTAATPPKAATSLPSFVELVELRRIPLAELHESPHNPRQRYDDMALKELAASLLQTGQLTPIIVRPRKGGGYEIAAGHRRYRAAVLAVKQQPDGAKYRGVDALEAKVVVLDDRAFIEVLNVENLQRDDLHPIEEAQGFRDLMTEAGYDVDEIAARFKITDAGVYYYAKSRKWKRPKEGAAAPAAAAPAKPPAGEQLSGSVRCTNPECGSWTDFDPCRVCGQKLKRNKW